MAVEIKRMWGTGPLRQWSDVPYGNWHAYHSDSYRGFAGSYVCDDCQMPVVGVYRQGRGEKWLCKACHVAAASRKTLDTKKTRR